MNFEDHLRTLAPADPSPGLKARIRVDLESRAVRGHWWPEVLRLALPAACAVGIAIALLVSMASSHSADALYSRREIPVSTSSHILQGTGANPVCVSSVTSVVVTKWRESASGREFVRIEPQLFLNYENLEIQ